MKTTYMNFNTQRSKLCHPTMFCDAVNLLLNRGNLAIFDKSIHIKITLMDIIMNIR